MHACRTSNSASVSPAYRLIGHALASSSCARHAFSLRSNARTPPRSSHTTFGRHAGGDRDRERPLANAVSSLEEEAAVLGPLVPCEGLVANAQAGNAWEVAEKLGPLVCEGLLANA